MRHMLNFTFDAGLTQAPLRQCVDSAGGTRGCGAAQAPEHCAVRATTVARVRT